MVQKVIARMRAARVARGSLFALGSATIGVAFTLPAPRDELAAWALTLGATMAILAALIPWIRRAQVSPTAGLSVAMRDPQGEVAAELAEEVGADERRVGAVGARVDEDELIGAGRLNAASAAIEGIVNTTYTLELSDCEWHLYLYDSDRDWLLPVFEPADDPESEGWQVGKGATGTAWARREFVVVAGAEASDGTYGLSAEQQERYRSLHAVAAIPVQSWSGAVIAVLSASTADHNTNLVRPEAFDELAVKAVQISRILIDLLKWFDD